MFPELLFYFTAKKAAPKRKKTTTVVVDGEDAEVDVETFNAEDDPLLDGVEPEKTKSKKESDERRAPHPWNIAGDHIPKKGFRGANFHRMELIALYELGLQYR